MEAHHGQQWHEILPRTIPSTTSTSTSTTLYERRSGLTHPILSLRGPKTTRRNGISAGDVDLSRPL